MKGILLMESSCYKQFIDTLPHFTKDMNQDGINALLHELGDFHKHLNVIHIAGTNGKGSSTMMLNSIYTCANYKTGAFTSPYINDYRECIHIGTSIISKELMTCATSKIETAYLSIKEKGYPLPTHYECLTVIALMAMYLERVDIAIIETLMGGRQDATNIFSKPLVCLITSISYDHMEYLGTSLESIASHKAGIIKENRPVIINQNEALVNEVLVGEAKEKQCDYYLSQAYTLRNYSKDILDQFIHNMALKGDHQVQNLYGVLSILGVIAQQYPVLSEQINEGLSSVKHPCRLEHITYEENDFIIDGSHNESGIEALRDYLLAYHPNKNYHFIIGMLKDKAIDPMVAKVYPIATSVTLSTPLSPRSFDPDDFYKSLNPENQAITNIDKSISHLISTIETPDHSREDLYIVCGSLYLCYPFRKALH